MEILFYGSTGPLTKLLQKTLNRLGYNAGEMDGIFGEQTEQAVKQVRLGIGAKNAGDYHLLEKTQRLDQNQQATDRENIFQQTRLHPRVSFQIFKSLLQRLLFVGRSLPA